MMFGPRAANIFPISLIPLLLLGALPGPGPASAAETTQWPRPGSKTWTNSVGMEFVRIPSWSFYMGTSGDNLERIMRIHLMASGKEPDPELFAPEQPSHKIKISDAFYLGKYEVTVGQFRKFVEETGYRTSAEKMGFGFDFSQLPPQGLPGLTWQSPFRGQSPRDDHPVVHVSWQDAQAFVSWLNQKEGANRYRLPTEAEWEHAARGGLEEKLFPWGNEQVSREPLSNLGDESGAAEYGLKNYLVDYFDGSGGPSPVGHYPSNRFGLHDMGGNVSEWCHDWYDPGYYKVSARRDPQGPHSGTERVCRGGSWISYGTGGRVAARKKLWPWASGSAFGFRVAMDGASLEDSHRPGKSMLWLSDAVGDNVWNEWHSWTNVVRGKVKNLYRYPVVGVRIEATLSSSVSTFVHKEIVYAGRILSKDELRTLSREEVGALLNSPQDTPGGTQPLNPGQQTDFMVVFFDLRGGQSKCDLSSYGSRPYFPARATREKTQAEESAEMYASLAEAYLARGGVERAEKFLARAEELNNRDNQVEEVQQRLQKAKEESRKSTGDQTPGPESRSDGKDEPLKYWTNALGMKFVKVPESGILMGVFEVTQAQWQMVVGDNPSRFKGPTNPVEQVSWEDVQDFLRRLRAQENGLGYRLPTMEEWSRACRGGHLRQYAYGNDDSRLGEYAWFKDNSGGQTHPVGRKKPSSWGLYDLHGNVAEWCQDPASQSYWHYMGGSWDSAPIDTQTTSSHGTSHHNKSDKIGFRLVLDESETLTGKPERGRIDDAKGLHLSGVHGFLARTEKGNPVFVVAGTVTNTTWDPIREVRLKGIIHTKGWRNFAKQYIHLGHVYTDKDLAGYSPKFMLSVLSSPQAGKGGRTALEPEESTQFLIPFYDPPEDLSSFDVAVVSAESG